MAQHALCLTSHLSGTPWHCRLLATTPNVGTSLQILGPDWAQEPGTTVQQLQHKTPSAPSSFFSMCWEQCCAPAVHAWCSRIRVGRSALNHGPCLARGVCALASSITACEACLHQMHHNLRPTAATETSAGMQHLMLTLNLFSFATQHCACTAQLSQAQHQACNPCQAT